MRVSSKLYLEKFNCTQNIKTLKKQKNVCLISLYLTYTVCMIKLKGLA